MQKDRSPHFSSKPLTFKDREEIRKYLEGLKPQEIKALKDKKPAEYRAVLKSIVRKLFPKGADIQFRKDRVIDYDHFLTDRTRQNYIHVLPSTLRREDLRVEFKNGDVDKELLIKKYFDPEIQKDIWDIVVIHNDQIRTKVAATKRKGSGYVEGQIMRAGNAASHSATPEGIRENASTLDRSTNDNIADKTNEGNGEEDPDILFGLSAKDMADRVKTQILGEPKADLRVVFGEQAEKDLRDLRDSFRIPAWLAKTNKTVKALFERQNRRDKDRSSLYHGMLTEAKAVFDLDREQMQEFSKLAFGLENKKVVEAPRFVKVGDRELVKGPRRIAVKVPIYELNEDHYAELGRHLDKEKVSKPVRDAYLAARRTLDKSLIKIWDRLAEIKNIDPNLIEEFRGRMGSIENYFPHSRYGNYHIRAIDPTAKEGENTRYRMHFDALNDTHANWWAKKNIERIKKEAAEESPGTNWDGLKWEVDRNRQLPEEVYDFPIPADRMPEDLRKDIRTVLSEEVSNVLKSRGFGSHMIKRKDIPGFERDDVARVLHDHFAGFSGWLTKMEAAHDFGEVLRGIDAKDKPNEYRWGTRFVQDMLQNQTRLDRVVDGAKAFFFMKCPGLNMKTAAVNLTQNMIAGVPRLSHGHRAGPGREARERGVHVPQLFAQSAFSLEVDAHGRGQGREAGLRAINRGHDRSWRFRGGPALRDHRGAHSSALRGGPAGERIEKVSSSGDARHRHVRDAVESRKKARQPMKQMRGLSRELREACGM